MMTYYDRYFSVPLKAFTKHLRPQISKRGTVFITSLGIGKACRDAACAGFRGEMCMDEAEYESALLLTKPKYINVQLAINYIVLFSSQSVDYIREGLSSTCRKQCEQLVQSYFPLTANLSDISRYQKWRRPHF